jgi:large subunit ribosomal protein L23
MALLDFLKKKEEIKKSKPDPRGTPKASKVSAVKKTEKIEKKVEKTEAVKMPAIKTSNAKFSYEAIKKPHISEKASDLSASDQYIFEVSPNYNKNEIKKSVEGLYGVNVLSVNIVKIPHKKRRLGKTEGFRKAYKKAIVRIKNGQKIEIL